LLALLLLAGLLAGLPLAADEPADAEVTPVSGYFEKNPGLVGHNYLIVVLLKGGYELEGVSLTPAGGVLAELAAGTAYTLTGSNLFTFTRE